MEDVDRIRLLFEDLESKKSLVHLLDLAEKAEGVRIFIGSENNLFSLSGSSLIVAPFQDKERKIVGMLGVIGRPASTMPALSPWLISPRSWSAAC